MDDINEKCTCKGKCSVCVNAVGRSQAVYLECPHCPLHGHTLIAKRARRAILGLSSQE